MRRLLFPLVAGLLLAPGAQAAQVRYMLWDASQLPAYRQCAADFARTRPGTTVKIVQAGWDDYWTSVSTGFIADSAPDVFTNHLAKMPAYAANGLLADLTPWIRRDAVDLAPFPAPLVQAWARDGRQYGLPKDWDTIGLVVNLAHAKKAGVSLAELQAMDWNPTDGGSFERTVRRLTLDTQGRNATDPAFDRRSVAVYGYQSPGPGGMFGQTEWSHFAASTGFRVQERPWALPYRYDDPRLAGTVDWLAGLPAKGLSAPYAYTKGMGSGPMFVAGRAAMVPEGSWMIGYFAANAKFENAWVPLPRGPVGRRASMLNGLADSMWVGSRVKEEAWAWMKYLASRECQSVVARFGVVLPAYEGLAAQVIDAHRRRGVDAGAFLTMAGELTFLPPIADRGAEVDEIVKTALESVALGRAPAAAALRDAQQKIDRLFQPKAAR